MCHIISQAKVSEMEDCVDLVLVVGSSLSSEGEWAESGQKLVARVAERAGQGEALGVVIISLQPSNLDCLASLRISNSFDFVGTHLAKHLSLSVVKPSTRKRIEHRMTVPYNAEGVQVTEAGPRMVVDLSPGQEVRLQPGHNCQGCGGEAVAHISRGEIVREGRRVVRSLARGVGRVISYSPTTRAWELELEGVKMLLGYWWLEDCARGGPAYCPVLNCKPVMANK